MRWRLLLCHLPRLRRSRLGRQISPTRCPRGRHVGVRARPPRNEPAELSARPETGARRPRRRGGEGTDLAAAPSFVAQFRPVATQAVGARMTFVVTESCIKCKYTDCVEVCPVDCFHEGPNMLVIDPEECIDCTLCEPECPVEAIVSEDDVPAGQEQFTKLNADLSKNWPVITKAKEAPADADDWKDVKDKLKHLER